MDAQALAARPGILHKDVGSDIPHLADDTDFVQPVEAHTRSEIGLPRQGRLTTFASNPKKAYSFSTSHKGEICQGEGQP